MKMVWDEASNNFICVFPAASEVPAGYLLTNGMPNLIWTARELFQSPFKEDIIANKNELMELLDLGMEAGLCSAADLRAELDMESCNWDKIEVDFTSLFINSFPTAKAHPFAGWYKGEKIVFGASDLEMRQLYAQYGVDFDVNQPLPADHILVELEFMAGMAENYIKTGDQSSWLALQDMMNGHMRYWIFEFIEAMEKHAQSSYYRIMASVLSVLFIELQKQLKGVA